MSQIDLFKAKARAIADSIEGMGEKMQLHQPSGEFGRDYNQFLESVNQEVPQLRPLLPPRAEVDEHTTYTNMAEIRIYCEQLFQLLANVQDLPE